MAFETYHHAKRVLDVLDKRFARYGLRLHPEKTRFVDFRFTRPDGKQHPETDGTTFTFLGFCHVWGKSRKGKSVVRRGRAWVPVGGQCVAPIRNPDQCTRAALG